MAMDGVEAAAQTSPPTDRAREEMCSGGRLGGGGLDLAWARGASWLDLASDGSGDVDAATAWMVWRRQAGPHLRLIRWLRGGCGPAGAVGAAAPLSVCVCVWQMGLRWRRFMCVLG